MQRLGVFRNTFRMRSAVFFPMLAHIHVFGRKGNCHSD